MPEKEFPVSEAVPHLRPAACPRIAEPPARHLLREKVLARGPAVLSNTELLTILLGAGESKRCLKIAHRLIRRHRLQNLEKLTLKHLTNTPGVGIQGALRVAASIELHRRLTRLLQDERPKITKPREAHAHVAELRHYRKEHLVALYLDANNLLIAKETLTIGSLNVTRTSPREILQPAIEHLALGFILVHNHPSGSLTPSVDDVEFTRSVRRAGELMGIDLYDHLIVSSRGFVSMKEKGLL